jgi:hypothetical protein
MREDIWCLTGKGIAQVSAEAAALKLSYGEYVAGIETGTIEAILRDRGITDGPDRILRASWKRKRRMYHYG